MRDPFVYQPPTPETLPLHEQVKKAVAGFTEITSLTSGTPPTFEQVNTAAKAVYDLILEIVPECEDRERALAATRLARMRANRSIQERNGRVAMLALDTMVEAGMWASAAIALNPLSQDPPARTPDSTGFDKIPDRYKGGGRETVDKMRDLCNQMGRDNGVSGDLLFRAACLTHELKYRDRIKNPEDPEKADWWKQMADSIYGDEPDPRSNREGYTPYVEQREKPAVYGYCPKCGAPGVMRERRLNGNDTCEKGHVYPSASAVKI